MSRLTSSRAQHTLRVVAARLCRQRLKAARQAAEQLAQGRTDSLARGADAVRKRAAKRTPTGLVVLAQGTELAGEQPRNEVLPLPSQMPQLASSEQQQQQQQQQGGAAGLNASQVGVPKALLLPAAA